MESTGNYWKPVYNIFEDEQISTIIVNAQHIKGVPGRKTDMKDAEWIADLVRHGLVKASFIPNRKQRELREITRYRQELIGERARELNRIQAVLEGCNLKLGSVITDINGKSGIAILKAIVSGETDSIALSELAKGKARSKVAELQRALRGSVHLHQRLMLKHQLDHIEDLSKIIEDLDSDIMEKTEFMNKQIQLLDEIPGIGRKSAERLLAEIGIEMGQFKNQSHFSSWAGLVPKCKESAGKKMSSRIRKGNKHVKAVLVECARSAVRNKKTYFYSRYQRIAARRGGKRALIAIAHSMLIAIYHILKNLQPYKELGCDYYSTFNQEKIIQKNIHSLERLGLKVQIE
ncbi:MAG: IS110 family transposase [Lachnospiraceae bacterium]|nr:IS110 family transposase [Lachnospiraceae bacterium]